MSQGRTTITVHNDTLELLHLAGLQIQAREQKSLSMNEIILRLLHAANRPSASRNEIETAAAIGAAAVVTRNQEK